MKIAATVLALTLATTTLAPPVLADAIEEVRQAETGFAKAFADRDKTKFFSYVADDAVFMNALTTLRGKDAVVKRWSRFFDNVPVAPFSWGPERVEPRSRSAWRNCVWRPSSSSPVTQPCGT